MALIISPGLHSMLFSRRSITALLLALFVLVSGAWMSIEGTDLSHAPNPAGWQTGHHLHDHSHDATEKQGGLASAASDCDQHQGCHVHSPAAVQSLTGQPPEHPDVSLHQSIASPYCSQSSEPPVPPPDFA